MKMITRKIFALLLALCLLTGTLAVAAAEETPPCPHEVTAEREENRVEATCTQTGSYDLVTYCTGCGEVLQRETMSIPEADHQNNEKWVEIPATCAAEGLRYLSIFCDNCGFESGRMAEETLEKVDHTPGEPVRENEMGATCETAGSYESVVYCVACGEALKRETGTIEALGHDWGEWTTTTPATCRAEGEERRVCKRDPAHTETRAIPMSETQHDLTTVAAVEASCEQKGNIEYYVCGVCGKWFERDAVEIADHSSVAIEALGHQWATMRVKPATCTEKGTVSYTCFRCGDRRDTETALLGHVLTYVPAVEPDASGKDGCVAHYACKRCGLLFYDADGQKSAPSMDSLLIRVKNDGEIQANGGVVQTNYGVIAENTGTIEANYGVIAENTGTVNHQFYNMTSKMDAGAYSVKYDDSFQCAQTGKNGFNMFLEAGQSGVITLDAAHGSRITKVTYSLNGEELELEDLGGGKYRITAPGMPEGPGGFAFNEGNLHVEIQEDPDAADDDSWKTESLLNLERQDKSINLLKVMDRDRNLNKHDAAIRVEGMDFDAASKEFRQMLASRSDIMNALAEAANSGENGTMIFVLDNGARIICDIARTRGVIIDLLPKVQYKPEVEDPDEELNELISELKDADKGSSSYGQQMDKIEIILVFKYEEEAVKFEETNKNPAPAPQKFDEPESPKDKKCLTPDTLIMLADGSEKRVDELENADRLLAWDFDNGCLTDVPMTFFHVVKEEAPVLRVSFSDGTSVGIVGEHVFFDLTDRRFVAIQSAEQEESLAGHSFAKLVDGQITEVVLSGIREDGVTDSYYSPVTQAHFNCFANGMLNISGFMHGLYNVFDLEENELKYNAEKKAAELAAVGELPYEIFEGLFPRELFESNNAGWLSVSVAKGRIHLRDLYELFDFCGPFFVEPGSAD